MLLFYLSFDMLFISTGGANLTHVLFYEIFSPVPQGEIAVNVGHTLAIVALAFASAVQEASAGQV